VVNILRDGGVPCFSLPGEAARAMAALARYSTIRARETGELKTFSDADRQKGLSILSRAKQSGRRNLAAEEVYGILEAYGIATADWRVAANADEAVTAAETIGFPVVVKADSAAVVHKSDMGAVAVNLADVDAVRATVDRMQTSLAADDLRFLVQKFMPGGLEVILGAKAEEDLGHLIMFGLGGIHVDVLKDVVFNLTPVSTTEAKEMLAAIKGAPLLNGVRGRKGVNRGRLEELIQRLSQLVSDLPAIKEMDLNPVMAFEDGAIVVDARISI
ncbi:MAG: acetate--CoA ligase family protein, partial [Desulfobacterales bacterium]